MSDEQNPESGGPPPPPPPTPPSTEWLPPRLRDRLASADEPPPKGESPLVGILVFVVIAGIVAGLVYWKMGQGAAAKKAEAKAAAAAREVAVADSLRQIALADSIKQAARADSAARFDALPAWQKQQLIAAKGDTSKAKASAAAESGRFAIDAGTFLFEDAAQTAANTIKGKTKLAVKVVPIESEFHVYVGDFRARGEATYLANQLFEKGTIEQANVVKVE